MFFKQLATRDASLSYFFGCGGLGKAVAVDVVEGDEPWFLEQVAQAQVTLTHVIDTHVHADHVSGGRKLAELTGAAYCLHENARDAVQFDFESLHDDQIIAAGNVLVRVLHTPGHTLDSTCLLVSDKRRSEAPWFALTGDTLFVGAVGRLCPPSWRSSQGIRREAPAVRGCQASPRRPSGLRHAGTRRSACRARRSSSCCSGRFRRARRRWIASWPSTPDRSRPRTKSDHDANTAQHTPAR